MNESEDDNPAIQFYGENSLNDTGQRDSFGVMNSV